MKSNRHLILKAMAIVLLMLAFISLKAQPTFLLSIRNDVQTSDKTFEFDVYLLRTGGTDPFFLAQCQTGIQLNTAIQNGGTVTFSIVPGYSDLQSGQQPTSSQIATATIWQIRMITPTVSVSSASTISSSSPGTRICRIKVTNSVPFAIAAPDMVFTTTSPGYLTKVAAYIAGTNTQLACNQTNCVNTFSNNPVLNAVPLAFNVTGGGSYCEGSEGLTVSLDNSQIGVLTNYIMAQILQGIQLPVQDQQSLLITKPRVLIQLKAKVLAISLI